MAIFEVIEGQPGQGKSLYFSVLALKLLQRNMKWHKQNPDLPIRRIAYNHPLSTEFVNKYPKFFVKWNSSSDLVRLRDVDILWDEVATLLDSRNWALLSEEFRTFLSQYRKFGVDIYSNTQDFSMIDVRARLMVTSVKTLTKVIGSRDLSATKPNPKRIWGIIWVREVTNLKQVRKNPEEKQLSWFPPEIFFIQKHLTDMYDTRGQIFGGEPLKLRHRDVYCERYGQIDPLTGKKHDCSFHKTLHI